MRLGRAGSLHKGVTLAQMRPFSRWLMIKGFQGHKNSVDRGIERWKIYYITGNPEH